MSNENPNLPQQIFGEQIQVGAEQHQVLEKNFVEKIRKGITVLDVSNVKLFLGNNTVATTLTEFKNGQEGQHITIHGDGYTSVANNAKIKTIEGATKLLTLGRVYSFIKLAGVWHEEGANATAAAPATDLSNYYTKSETYSKVETLSALTGYVPWDTQKRVLIGNQNAHAYTGPILPDFEINHIDANTTLNRSYGIAVNRIIKPAGSHPNNLIGAAIVGNISTDTTNSSNLGSVYGLSFSATHRGTGAITGTLYGIDVGAQAVAGAGTINNIVGISAITTSGPGTTPGMFSGSFQGIVNGGAGSICSDLRVITLRPQVITGNTVLLRCLNVRIPFMGGGTITEAYGVYIEDHSAIATSGGIKDNIRSKGVNAKNVIEGSLTVGADLESTGVSKGIIMKSPNGTRYRLTVNDDGTLTTTAI